MSVLQRLPIRARLRLGVVACALLLTALGLVSLINLKSVGAGVTALEGDALPRLTLAATVAEGAEAFRQDQFRHVLAVGAGRQAEVAVELSDHQAAVDSAFEATQLLVGDDGAGRRRFDAALAAWNAYVERTRGLVGASRADRAQAAAIPDAAITEWNRLGVALDAQQQQIRADADAVARSTHATFRRSGLTSFALTVLAILVAAAMWFALDAVAAPRVTESAEREPEAAPEGAPAAPDGSEPAGAVQGPSELDGTLGPIVRAGLETREVPIDPPFPADRIDSVVGTITRLADAAALLGAQAREKSDYGGEAGPGLGLVADGVCTLADDAKAVAARISAAIEGLRVSQSLQVLTDVAETIKGLGEQSYSITVDIAVEAARAGAEEESFDAIAAAVDRITEELESCAGQVDDVRRDFRPDPVPAEA